MTDTFLQERLTKTEATIAIYEDAIDAIVTTGAATFSLDTGQHKQTVTQADVESLQRQLSRLYERRNALRSQLGYSDNSGLMRAGW